ncbi:MAG: lauroyl acyltransferase [Rhodospirillales bacterium]|nr:lauroyl acyltransferase [Rhodospirillales bacterium]
MRRRTPLRRIRHAVEAIGLHSAMAASRALDIDRASALGSRLLRTLGPRIPLHATAEDNLRRILPELDAAGRDRVLSGMWDNLGRLVFEFPHLHRLDPFRPQVAPLPDGTPRFQLEGLEVVEGLRARGQCAVFASAHLANWEIGALVLTRAGMPMTYVYRQADNPWADDVIQSYRLEDAEFVRKRHAGRALLDALRRGRSVGVVNDQKLTEGPLVDFLGVPAGTAPMAASLALRASLPVFPLRVQRTGGAAFRVTIEPALPTPAERGTQRERRLALLRSLNERYSDWIRDCPEQWLWIHRRWPA